MSDTSNKCDTCDTSKYCDKCDTHDTSKCCDKYDTSDTSKKCATCDIPCVPTSFRQEFSKKSLNVTNIEKTRESLLTF